jgi:hypothetical protein
MVCRCGVFYWTNAAAKSGMETENLPGSSIKPKSSCRALSTSEKTAARKEQHCPRRRAEEHDDRDTETTSGTADRRSMIKAIHIYEQQSNHDRGGRNSCRTAFGAGRSGDSKKGMLNNGGIVEAIRNRREGDTHLGEETRSRSYCMLLLLVVRLSSDKISS